MKPNKRHGAGDALRAYIYTIPKAGTYLMDEYLTQLGMTPTGWHVSMTHYLDTRQFDADTNRVQPSSTSVPRSYLGTLKNVPAGGHAFGHFSPSFIPPALLQSLNYRIVAVRRHPKEVLVSEFIDFRHRRSDVRFVSEATVPDPAEAFAIYLREHGPVIKNICANYALLRDLHLNHFYQELVGRHRFIFADFRTFIDAKRGGDTALRIAEFLGIDLPQDEVLARWRAALDADNKTKSDTVQLPYARESLWTPTALQLYKDLGLAAMESHLGY